MSGSSDFTLTIKMDLVDGRSVRFDARGGTGETGRVDYFDDDAMVYVSPRELGNAKSVDELIRLLAEGVVDGWDETKIFDASRPVRSDFDGRVYDAYDFIVEIQDSITSMDQIESITISAEEENDWSYYRTYTYHLKTKQYTGTEEGFAFEKDGSSGGDLCFSDLDVCEIEYIETDE